MHRLHSYFSNMQKEVVSGGVRDRAHNRRLLLQLLRSGGHLSRGQLAEGASLSPAAVTNVAADLLDAGLVEEHAPVKSVEGGRLGRPATRLALAAAGPMVLSVQVGVGLLQVGLCDLRGTVLARQQAAFESPDLESRAVGKAIGMGRTLLRRRALQGRPLIGVGVGSAGSVDPGQRLVSQEVLGWDEVPVADAFEDAFGVDCVVDHNVRAMAIGESRYGVGRGLSSLGFIYIRRGVGAGLILDGKAYRDRHNHAAEFGHMRVTGSGPLCRCGGAGCLETVVSDAPVRRRLEAIGVVAPGSQDFVRPFLEAVRDGHDAAVRLRDDVVDHVGTALVNVVNLLNPEVVVLGGLLHDLSPVLSGALQDTVTSRVVPNLSAGVRVVTSAHGRDAGLVGAGTLALDRFVFGEVQLPATTAS